MRKVAKIGLVLAVFLSLLAVACTQTVLPTGNAGGGIGADQPPVYTGENNTNESTVNGAAAGTEVTVVNDTNGTRNPGLARQWNVVKDENDTNESNETSSGSMAAADTIEPMKTVVVEITASGFSPANVTISKGDSVMWVNNDQVAHWPASAKHPTHELYPQGGGCIGSAFDACKGLEPGENWTFQFNSTGSWGYHDHIVFGAPFFGTVNVG